MRLNVFPVSYTHLSRVHGQSLSNDSYRVGKADEKAKSEEITFVENASRMKNMVNVKCTDRSMFGFSIYTFYLSILTVYFIYSFGIRIQTVSYTHLDVYKRQV